MTAATNTIAEHPTSTRQKSAEERVCDEASIALIKRAEAQCLDTCFARADTQRASCLSGMAGVCCRICYMGPCRITKHAPRGVCGADADTIVARNYLREVAGGTAAHSDHGRHLCLLLSKVAKGPVREGYGIRDERALRTAALLYGIPEDGRASREVAGDLAARLLAEFTSQEEPLATLRLAPPRRQSLWQAKGTEPLGIDRMVVESLHRSTMGVDHDHRSILRQAFRTALADGWGGSRIATLVSDILFGTPSPVRSSANLGVLRSDQVNIVVHGHEPELSEMLALAASEPASLAQARESGASGVNLVGICCTANEILMRHGIPIAGSFLQQELALVTGAVEMMIVDVQCCMPSLPQVAKAYHTEVVATSALAQTVGATHLPYSTDGALEAARSLVRRAIGNFKRRDPGKVAIPSASKPLIAGFSVPAIKYMLGGSYRASFRPLNDAIMQGRIKGVVGMVGCTNPRQKVDAYSNALTSELIKHNVLVLKTGCAAIASAKEGMLTPETALARAGPGLREVCEAIGIPPILFMGSCVDNSRLLEACTEMVQEGGLGDDISSLPVVGIAPEWMSEKAVAIGCYFVASGIDVILGHPFHISGSAEVTRFLEEEAAQLYGASFHVRADPQAALHLILELLDGRRERLGINKKVERKLFDMKDRRELHV